MLVARQFSGVGVVGAEQYAVITFASISGAGDGQGMRGFIPRKIKSRSGGWRDQCYRAKGRGRCSFILGFLYFMRKKSLLSTRKYSITKIPLSCPDTFIKTHVKPFSVILIAKQRKKSLRLTIPQFVNSMAEELKATAPADKKHSKTKKTTTKRPETYLSSLLPAL